MDVNNNNKFAPQTLIPTVEPPKYDHGFTEEQVELITRKRKEIDKRDLNLHPVTLQELKEVVFPYQRINRTNIFILKEKEVKEKKEKVAREPKAPKEPRQPKEKKLSAKTISKRVSDIILARAMGMPVSAEDEAFYQEHAPKKLP